MQPAIPFDAFAAVLQFLTALLIAVLGWHAKRHSERLDQAIERLNRLELKVAENHPTKAEMVHLREEIREVVSDAVAPLRAEISLLTRMIDRKNP